MAPTSKDYRILFPKCQEINGLPDISDYNTAVIVERNASRYVASFFSYKNVELHNGKIVIKVLSDVCEGKMYVEAECARLHLQMAKILESKSDIENACKEIQDIHVETYGTLDKKEKAEFILEQIRLALGK